MKRRNSPFRITRKREKDFSFITGPFKPPLIPPLSSFIISSEKHFSLSESKQDTPNWKYCLDLKKEKQPFDKEVASIYMRDIFWHHVLVRILTPSVSCDWFFYPGDDQWLLWLNVNLLACFFFFLPLSRPWYISGKCFGKCCLWWNQQAFEICQTDRLEWGAEQVESSAFALAIDCTCQN